MAAPFNVPLPAPGEKPWNLNPAVEEVRSRIGAVNDLTTTGRLGEEALNAKFAPGSSVYLKNYLTAGATSAQNRTAYVAAVSAAASFGLPLCYDGAFFTMAGEPVESTAAGATHWASDWASHKVIQETKGKPVLVVKGERTTVSGLWVDGDDPNLTADLTGRGFRTCGIWVDPAAHDSTIRNIKGGGFFYLVRASLKPWSEMSAATSDPTVYTAANYPTEEAYPSLRNLTVDGLQSDGNWAAFHCVAVDGLKLSRINGWYQAKGSADPHLVYLNCINDTDERIIYRWTKNVVWDDCLATGTVGGVRHAYRARGVDGLTYSNLRAVDSPGLLQFITVKNIQGGTACSSLRDRLPNTDGNGSISFLWCSGEIAPITVQFAPDVLNAAGLDLVDCTNLRVNRPTLEATNVTNRGSTFGAMVRLHGANAGCWIEEPKIVAAPEGVIQNAILFETTLGSGTNGATVNRPKITGGFSNGIRSSNAGSRILYDPDRVNVTGKKIRLAANTDPSTARLLNTYQPEQFYLDTRLLAWHMGEVTQDGATDPTLRWSSGQYGTYRAGTWVGDEKGRLSVSAATDYALALANVEVADVDITVDVKRVSAQRTGIALRGLNVQNTLAFVIRNATTVELIKRVSDVTTVIATGTITSFPAGFWRRLQVIAIGNRVLCRIDGVEVINATLAAGAESDTFTTPTRHGLYVHGDTVTGTAFQLPVVRSLT